jgi:hypothetical protein
MKKALIIICISISSISFSQTKENKSEHKLELRSNAKDEVISRIDNDKKEQRIELRKEQIQDRISRKLERKHERPHFDKNKDKKDQDKSREFKREKVKELREKRHEIIKERRNG